MGLHIDRQKKGLIVKTWPIKIWLNLKINLDCKELFLVKKIRSCNLELNCLETFWFAVGICYNGLDFNRVLKFL